MSRLAPGRRQGGFTLVELLLAMVLLSMLLGLAYGGFRAATRATASGQALLEETGRLRITHQFIRRQLNQMLPLTFDIDVEGQADRVVFTGDARRIQYVAPMPGYLGTGGPQVQVMEVAGGGAGMELLFSHALLQEFLPERLYDRDPVVLLQGLEYAEFQFLGRNERGEIMGWSTFWDDPTILPEAVRLDLGFGEGSRVSWPLLATGVRVDEASVRQTANTRDYGETIRDMIRNRRKDDE